MGFNIKKDPEIEKRDEEYIKGLQENADRLKKQKKMWGKKSNFNKTGTPEEDITESQAEVTRAKSYLQPEKAHKYRIKNGRYEEYR